MNHNGLIDGALLTLKRDGKLVDYHDEWTNSMNAPRFLHWLEHTLIPLLSARAVVVMNNAPYHSS